MLKLFGNSIISIQKMIDLMIASTDTEIMKFSWQIIF